jgi:hypothetical protein
MEMHAPAARVRRVVLVALAAVSLLAAVGDGIRPDPGKCHHALHDGDPILVPCDAADHGRRLS